MGKKGKKKARSGHKEKRVSSVSQKTASQQRNATSNTEATDTVTTVVHDKRLCPHVDKGVNLEKLSAKLKSSEPLKCEDCREGGGRGSKGKAKQGKQKGVAESRSESKAIWVCLDCGHFSCGGVGLPTTPNTHATRHARLDHHPLAIQFGNPQLRWCFPCSMLIRAEKSEDGVEQKDVFHEVVKMMKVQPSEGPALDAEDVWFGSGSVNSGVISENCPAVSSNGRGSYSVKGLVNLGNTCFFNSVMQNLLALSRLREYYCKLDGSFGPLTAALKKLVAETNPESGLRNVINPRSFFGSVCSNAPQFRGYQQQDSHELLRCLLDGLSTEELSARKQDKSFQEDGKLDPIFVDAVFGGQLSSTVTCLECKHSSLVYEPFLDLSLPVPTKKPPSRKAQQMVRAKKPKPPPKRNAKIHPKICRDINAVPSANASADGHSSSPVQSSVHVPEPNAVSSGDSTNLVHTDTSVMADSKSLLTNSLLSTRRAESSQAIEDVITPTDNSSWLDVLDADANEYFQMDDHSVNHGSADENAVQNDVPLQNSLECSRENVSIWMDSANCSYKSVWVDQHEQEKLLSDQVMDLQINEKLVLNDSGVRNAIQSEVVGHSESCSFSCSKDLNLGVGSSGKFSEEETPLLVQYSEVLLLPYKEDTFVSSEIPKTEAEMSSSAIGHEHESLDFDGFGDLFNEPEVAGPSLKSSVDNASEENQVLQAGFSGNTSDSEPDEVDNSNSPVSVESCLSYFTKPELLLQKEHAWQCENCSKILQEQKMRSRRNLWNSRSESAVNRDVDTTTSALSHLHCLHENHPPSSEVRHLCNGNLKNGMVDTSDDNFVSDDGMIKSKKNCLLENGEKAESNPITSSLADINGEFELAPACLPESSCGDKKFPELDNNYKNCEGFHVDESRFDGDADGDVQKEVVQAGSMRRESDGEDDEEKNQEIVKVKRDATKRILINRAPPILTIHLKRFSQDARGRLSKLNGYVQFSDTIDLKPFMDTRCAERDDCKYRLVGVVEHSGTMRGGHYIAYVRGGVKNPPKSEDEAGDYVWHHASDAYVREASLEEVLRSEAYILFYERI